ncbi:MAG: hypothetical protein Q8916_05635 [Bacteroidota bacterium]|nr:hypothetical protein [Bacteroidota bacterium]MDP4229872.1 hypothetical protein [Bacteroidota bacterium]MDP4235991.1 hypothetical protein [Bacteroidota bacterium]
MPDELVELPFPNLLSRDVKKSTFAFLLLALSLLPGCRKEHHASAPARAFYYWKHEYKLGNLEDSALSTLHIKKIYVKFFDVTASDHGAIPVATIGFDSSSLRSNIEYVPVIFITQAALLGTDEKLIDTLAAEIVSKTFRIADREGLQLHEIQLDCDWAQHSRAKYFRLVEVIGKLVAQRKMITSCTIRLHQVKYRSESGLPPCSRGMLMFYNMTDWRRPQTKNSIFDPEEAEKYLPYIKDYPMQLDVALPIFHWAIAYRGASFLAILDGARRDMLTAKNIFVADGDKFRVLRDTFAFGARLQSGDMIRAESCDAKIIAQYSARISSLLPDEERSFALFHLDSATLTRYSHDELESLFPH